MPDTMSLGHDRGRGIEVVGVGKAIGRREPMQGHNGDADTREPEPEGDADPSHRGHGRPGNRRVEEAGGEATSKAPGRHCAGGNTVNPWTPENACPGLPDRSRTGKRPTAKAQAPFERQAGALPGAAAVGRHHQKCTKSHSPKPWPQIGGERKPRRHQGQPDPTEEPSHHHQPWVRRHQQ